LTIAAPSGEMTLMKENHLAKQKVFICRVEKLRHALIKDLGPQQPLDKCASK